MQSSNIFNREDLAHIAARGTSAEAVLAQMESLRHGFPYTLLHRPCTLHDGIQTIEAYNVVRLTEAYSRAAAEGRVMSFVPASGAASRMFKPLLSFLNNPERIDHVLGQATLADDDQDGQDFRQFIAGLKHFAFHDDLQGILSRKGFNLQFLLDHHQYQLILECLLTSQGLNYVNLPKGLLKFHAYEDHQRTPFDEHLMESSLYIRSRNNSVDIDFTVPNQYVDVIKTHIDDFIQKHFEDPSHFHVSLSVQDRSTDTIAVELDNRPFRTADGQLLFRPGGHGSLLKNLASTQGDIIFIKNIDNVVPDHFKSETTRWRKMLGGYLVVLQDQIFDYLHKLSREEGNERLLGDVFAFARQELSVIPPSAIMHAPLQAQARYLQGALHRPLRVCGMVKNIGAPGGGPFWVAQQDGTHALQIVEASQVDITSAAQRAIIDSATHFNPVELVCGVRDYRGKQFDLQRFVDPEAGFVAIKSYRGRDLKTLEWPGLWNGGMAYWNTVFVKVPSAIFNPVKTVLDLLRPEHQPG